MEYFKYSIQTVFEQMLDATLQRDPLLGGPNSCLKLKEQYKGRGEALK